MEKQVSEAAPSLPRVAVILLNWNGAEFTIPCIQSLQRQDYNNIEIIVVDNGSQDDSLARLETEFGPQITLIPLEKNLGFTGGNNLGIERALQSGADYVLILNNDTVAHPDFIKELVTLAETDTNIGAVTGKIFYFEPRDVLWFTGGDVRRGLLSSVARGIGDKDAGQWDEVRESPFVSGCCMLIRREVIEKVGAFDDRFFIYVEDVDLSLRINRAGYRSMYAPQAVLWHKESASVRKNTLKNQLDRMSPFQRYLGTRNRIFLVRKHGTPLEKVAFISLLIGRTLWWTPLFTARGRGESLAAVWKGIRHGLATDLSINDPVPG